MVRLCERQGFLAATKPDDPQVVQVSLALEPEPAIS
jgi:hypothetical protein